jgi:putative mRNA 3-end processing factor
MSLIEFKEEGIYCPQADIYIDPWHAVKRAIITHGHSDHARSGSKYYLTHRDNLPIIKRRLGSSINAEGKEYGETSRINGVSFSLHPAGHIIGSSQVRVEYKGEVWVISGDYKLGNDNISVPFEPVKCHSFISESTFGLPVYHWKPQEEVFNQLHEWWKQNRESGLNSVVIAYSLGKAQRLIANLDESIGKVFVHGAVDQINRVLIDKIPKLAICRNATTEFDKKEDKGSLIITPSSGLGTPWLRKFEPYSLAMASGWMSLRGARRRRAADRGFIISDHADWDQLNIAVKETGAENIYVTHGYSLQFSRWLKEQGMNAEVVRTEFEGEVEE